MSARVLSMGSHRSAAITAAAIIACCSVRSDLTYIGSSRRRFSRVGRYLARQCVTGCAGGPFLPVMEAWRDQPSVICDGQGGDGFGCPKRLPSVARAAVCAFHRLLASASPGRRSTTADSEGTAVTAQPAIKCRRQYHRLAVQVRAILRSSTGAGQSLKTATVLSIFHHLHDSSAPIRYP
jgi:hypothetical protein